MSSSVAKSNRFKGRQGSSSNNGRGLLVKSSKNSNSRGRNGKSSGGNNNKSRYGDNNAMDNEDKKRRRKRRRKNLGMDGNNGDDGDDDNNGFDDDEDDDNAGGSRRRKNVDDDEISSVSSMEDDEEDEGANGLNESNPDTETEKRIKIAKDLIARMKDEDGGDKKRKSGRVNKLDDIYDDEERSSDDDDDEDDIGKPRYLDGEDGLDEGDKELRDRLTAKLKENVLLSSGKMHRPLGDFLESYLKENGLDAFSSIANDNVQLGEDGETKRIIGRRNLKKINTLATTCLAVDSSGAIAFTGSKDGSIIRWDLLTGKITKKINGIRKPLASFDKKPQEQHVGTILSLALSTDNRYLASGGSDCSIRLWNPSDLSFIACIHGQHRSQITSISFRYDSASFYTGSDDRSIRVWNANDQFSIEPLYGHRAEITCTDALVREVVISASVDRTIRLWRVAEQSHLVFECNPNQITGSIDCIKLLDDSNFVSGSQDGTIALWNSAKRKPLSLIKNAHGEGVWIVSLASLLNSDIFASGASDGTIKLWKVDFNRKQIQETPVAIFPNVDGFINGLSFDKSGKTLVAAVGNEHKLGRWKKTNTGNRVVVFNLPEMPSN